MTEPMIERAIYLLLREFPYYGGLLHSFQVRADYSIKTAGVGFSKRGDCIELVINPAYFAAQSDSGRRGLLIHECSHVDRLHLVRCGEFPDQERANIAADMAINGYIQGLPDGALYAKDYGLEEFQTLEYYYERVKVKPKDYVPDMAGQGASPQQNPGSGESKIDAGGASGQGDEKSEAGDQKKRVLVPAQTTDVHDWQKGGAQLSRDQKIDLVEDTIRRAVQKSLRGAGKMTDSRLPSHVQESLKVLRQMKTKNWQIETRMFIGKTVSGSQLEHTWSRASRRYGIQQAGTRSGGGKKLAVAFDVSISMSDNEIKKALTETMAMVKGDVDGYLILFDTEVRSVEKLRRIPELIVKHRGGTNFAPLMEMVDRLGCDGLVVFTDGDDAGICTRPKTPVLWVYTDGMRDKYNWGYKTLLDKDPF